MLEKEEMGGCEGDDYDPYEEYHSKGGDDEEEKSNWHTLDDDLDTTYSFKRIVDLKGRQLLSNVVTYELEFKESVLQECDPFEDADTEEEYENYVSNEVRKFVDANATNARMRADREKSPQSTH